MSNPYRVFKQLAVLTGFCIVACSSVQAQSSYYIYVQSDNAQPFYAQIGDKVYSSSAVGHLILAGLKDNVCNFEIGFPQHTIKTQQFSVPIKGKDHGYQLKRNGSQDWTLVNWQNSETIRPARGAGTSAVLYGDRKSDAFSSLMAAVVNDTAVLYTSIVKGDLLDPTSAVAKNDAKQTVAAETKTEEPKETTTGSAKKEEVAITVPVVPTVTADKPVQNDIPLLDTTAVVAKEYKAEKPLFDTTTAVKKEYKADKPLFDTATIAKKEYKADKPLFDTTTTAPAVYKNDKPLFDTTAVIAAAPVETAPVKDTAALVKTKKETKKAEKKAVDNRVVKVQETTNKDGETKLVFIDSSDTPANVVTVYIDDKDQPKTADQPIPANLNTETPKPVEEPKPEKKQEPKKNEAALKPETAKVEPVVTDTKKEAPKEGTNNNQPPVEAGKLENVKIVADKPVAKKGDTLTIVLESPQLKRDSARAIRQEAPKPLYEAKQVTEPVSKQPDAEKAGITGTNGAEPAAEQPKKQGLFGRKRDKNEPAMKEKSEPVVKTETNVTTKDAQPVTTKQDGAVNSKTFDAPVRTDNQPAKLTEAEKKVVMEANTQPKETSAPVTEPAKTGAATETTKPLTVTETPKTAAVESAKKIAAEETKTQTTTKPAETEKKKVVMINSDCAKLATDNDVDKLRVKMLAENDMTKKVAIANKAFKTMCLYAKQMKALSELFPTDDTRYNFLSMAYPFAADTENFKELYSLFGDASYQTKFKTLVRY